MTKIKLIEEDIEEFRRIEEYYLKNPEEEPLVDIVNKLPTDERNLILMLIQYHNDVAVLAEKLNVTKSYLSTKLNNIKKKVKENF